MPNSAMVALHRAPVPVQRAVAAHNLSLTPPAINATRLAKVPTKLKCKMFWFGHPRAGQGRRSEQDSQSSKLSCSCFEDENISDATCYLVVRPGRGMAKDVQSPSNEDTEMPTGIVACVLELVDCWGAEFPRGAVHFTRYLEQRTGEPCRPGAITSALSALRYFESAAGLPAGEPVEGDPWLKMEGRAIAQELRTGTRASRTRPVL